MIHIFRGHIRAYIIKGNEMLFELIYTLWFVGVVCQTGNDIFKRTESQEEIQAI